MQKRVLYKDFIQKCVNIILSNRIQLISQGEADSSFNVEDKKIEDIADFFSDELCCNKNNNYVLEVYYIKRDFKLLVEKFFFTYHFDEDININKLNKICCNLIRTILFLSKFLPAFSFFRNNGSHYFTYRLFSSIKSQTNFSAKTSKFRIKNEQVRLNINIEYLSKSDVIKSEEEYNYNSIKNIMKGGRERKRCFSLTEHNNPINPLKFEIIQDNYFSDSDAVVLRSHLLKTSDTSSSVDSNDEFELEINDDNGNDNGKDSEIIAKMKQVKRNNQSNFTLNLLNLNKMYLKFMKK